MKERGEGEGGGGGGGERRVREEEEEREERREEVGREGREGEEGGREREGGRGRGRKSDEKRDYTSLPHAPTTHTCLHCTSHILTTNLHHTHPYHTPLLHYTV